MCSLFEGGVLANRIKKIIENDKVLEGLQKASKDDTSELESFHSALNRNSPKQFGFSHNGMISR